MDREYPGARGGCFRRGNRDATTYDTSTHEARRLRSRAMSKLFAAIYDPFMRGTEQACLASWRAELLASAVGDTLEIGAGTGANVPHYPADLGRLVLAEPDPDMR